MAGSGAASGACVPDLLRVVGWRPLHGLPARGDLRPVLPDTNEYQVPDLRLR